MRPILLPFLICAQITVSSATAGDAPILAERASEDFRHQLPNFQVSVVDALTIRLVGPDHMEFQVNLDRINQYCSTTPQDCDRALADFESGIAETAKARVMAPTKDMLRAAVRPVNLAQEFKRELGGKDDAEPATTPLAGDLAIYCYFDSPRTMRVAMVSDIRSLGIGHNDAVELCEKNVEAALPPLTDEIKDLSERSFGALSESDYESSRLIFHDDWAVVAAKMHGHLIVAVPASNLVLYGEEEDASSLDAMAALAKRAFQVAQRPVSTEVFRWTAAGWDVAAP